MTAILGDSRLVGWVVDVQHDFMDPAGEGGRLYVHDLGDPSDEGARRVLPALGRTVRWMKSACAALVFTGDWHAEGDAEIDRVAPDPTIGTYPPHCMGLSADPHEAHGAALIDAVAPRGETIVLPRDAGVADARRAAAKAAHERTPVFVQKSRFSVFEGNPSADAFVRALAERLGGDVTFVVCGVATDVCVKAAVEGLLAHGRVVVVRDAVAGLGLIPDEQLFERWRERGVTFVQSAALD